MISSKLAPHSISSDTRMFRALPYSISARLAIALKTFYGRSSRMHALPHQFAFALPFLTTLAIIACHCHNIAHPLAPTPEATAPQIIEWLLGEQVRGPKTSNRGHVGIVIYDLTASNSTPFILPNSCGTALVRLIPTPEREGTRLAINESGQLLRYASTDVGWLPVPSPVPLPPLDELVAFSTASARLELLVRIAGERDRLTRLTFEGDKITAVDLVDSTTFRDRRETLQHYDSGRCLDSIRDCLHLIAKSGSSIVLREPVLSGNREEVRLSLGTGVRDIRYTNISGTKLDVLTTDACRIGGSNSSTQTKPITQPNHSQ